MVTYDIISWGGAMMNYRKYKSNPKELLEQGRAIARQKGNDAKFQHRVEIVNLVLSGHSPSELSKDMGCHINTIMRWVKAADEQGFESPQDGKHTGRPLRLSESQLQDIDNALQEDPSKHGYNVWDGLAISDFIQRTHGVFYAVRSCQRLAKRLGFSRVRPQVFPSKENEDTEERSEFKKN